MQKKRFHYARKRRQFRHLAKQVNRLIESGRFKLLAEEKRQQLVRRLRNLYQSLRGIISGRKLKHYLAGAALVLGLATTTANAQTFADPVSNPFNFLPINYWSLPTTVDLDNDGDLDLMVAGYGEYENGFNFKYYENVGTAEAPDFSDPIANPFGLTATEVIRAAFGDFDDDGDLDLFAGSYGNNSGFLYFENVGDAENPNFAVPVLNPFGLAAPYYFGFVDAVDIDNDGDLDLFSGEQYGELAFWENTGDAANPSFEGPDYNPFGLTNASSGYARLYDFVDIDNDGDLDFFYQDYGAYEDFLYYVENVGDADNPSFAEPVSGAFGMEVDGYNAAQINFADMDNDGDADMFAGQYYGSLQYFENLSETVNSFPTSSNAQVSLDEDTSYAFAESDFPYNDVEAVPLDSIIIETAPANGLFTYDGVDVIAGQSIPVPFTGAGLIYTPAPNGNGDVYDSFQFRVSDGTDESLSPYTMSIVVNPINDLPTSADVEIEIDINTQYDFSEVDFQFTDADGDELSAVRINVTAQVGALTLDGTPVVDSQEIPADQLNLLTFTPNPDEDGDDYDQFTFQVWDGTEFSMEEYTVLIDVRDPSSTINVLKDVQLNLAPNPVQDWLQVEAEFFAPVDQLQLSVVDAGGRVLFQQTPALNGLQLQTGFSVTDLTPGNYWLEIRTSQGVKAVAFIKH
jgi:hypothetical protein